MTSTPEPTKWHKKPRGLSERTCCVCGYPAKCRGVHRVVTDAERATASRCFRGRWVRRMWTGQRMEMFAVGVLHPRKQGRVGRRRSEESRNRIVRAATLAAEGHDHIEIAGTLGVTIQTVQHWCNSAGCRSLWQTAYDQTMEKVCAVVKAQMGTDEILADPDRYIAQATRAERWLQVKGESLFSGNGQTTLTSFYSDYYLPNCMSPSAGSAYKKQFGIALRRWQFLTGDPPLKEITVALLGKFRDALSKMRGLKPHLRMTARSVKRYLEYMQRLLDKAGPPGPRNRDAADILSRAPWIKAPHCPLPVPKIVSEEVLTAVYRTCPAMRRPKVDGFKPAAWWRGLLVLAYTTGLRRRTLFALRMAWIDWQQRIITIPPEAMKSARGHVVYLNETTYRHLLAIRTDRELVFPWSPRTGWGAAAVRAFHITLHKLQDVAAIPRDQHFGLQALRRTHATMMFRWSPEAARVSLAHTGMETTIGYYVNAEQILSAAVKQLPMPEVFARHKKTDADEIPIAPHLTDNAKPI